jgi:hypothetical protein
MHIGTGRPAVTVTEAISAATATHLLRGPLARVVPVRRQVARRGRDRRGAEDHAALPPFATSVRREAQRADLHHDG